MCAHCDNVDTMFAYRFVCVVERAILPFMKVSVDGIFPCVVMSGLLCVVVTLQCLVEVFILLLELFLC